MKTDTERKNWLEWSVTIVSAILVAFTLGILIYQMIYEEKTPPDIRVTLGNAEQKDGGYAILVSAFNQGTQTAQNVLIEVVLKKDGKEETAEITFQYLPRKSEVEGWVTFGTSPKAGQLQTRIIGYNVP